MGQGRKWDELGRGVWVTGNIQVEDKVQLILDGMWLIGNEVWVT